MSCPQRGSKLLGARVGAQLHADVFAAAKIRGTTATDFLVELLRAETARVLNETGRSNPDIVLASITTRFPISETINARRTIIYLDKANGRPYFRDNGGELATALDPAMRTDLMARLPAWRRGDPKPYARTHERKPKR